MQAIPVLKGQALEAAQYRGGHLQIIASAGSGKTEVVSQRVAGLLAEGVPPEGIVAFTFTERAASSLKSRIEQRAAAKLGLEILDSLNGMFVGTIHSYCFRILQQHVSRYETFDVLDDHRLTAFLTREFYNLGLPSLGSGMFAQIKRFGQNVQVAENELLEPHQLTDPFREVYERYVASLEEHRFLTYGQIIARAVNELRDPEVFASVHGPLRHLIVDEYQDINPAQEALIKRLAEPPVHLCVVGDDDQAIYQWRGSDVENILEFDRRYKKVREFRIERNRRSRPEIIRVANRFAKSIEPRLRKTMKEYRPDSGRTEVVCWTAETPEQEAERIAKAIKTAHDRHGYRYRDVAVLCRGRVSFPAILEALAAEDIPVQPGGRTFLFTQEDADLFGRTMCWLAGYNWRVGHYGWNEEPVTLDDLLTRYTARFGLARSSRTAVRRQLEEWKNGVEDQSRPANLVRDFYALLGALGVDGWDLRDVRLVNRLGTLARCSQVLVDYESTRRRPRPDHLSPGDMAWIHDRDLRYYQWLARYIQNWAKGAYEDFEGEEDVELDAVDVTTIHQAKGLEWPIVFVPALKSDRFPSRNTAQRGDWLVHRTLFDADRYEGSETDERRLLYVAMTRARDYLSLSTFRRMRNRATPSPFLLEVAGGEPSDMKRLPLPPPPDQSSEEQEVLEVTFSDLASFLECGHQYRLRRQIGFQPPLAPEIGYGKAVHHVLRSVAEYVRKHGRVPGTKQLDRIFDDHFYLPAAGRAGYRQMKSRGRKLVDRYLQEWSDELHRVWEVERPFELHLGDATIAGRADVIIDEADGGRPRLTIVDYKTAADGHDSHHFQLQVYVDAGRREGLEVDKAYVHDLKQAARDEAPVAAGDIHSAEARARVATRELRLKDYRPRPGPPCSRCDVRPLCPHRL